MDSILSLIEDIDIEEIVIRLDAADAAYHDGGNPIMEDFEYDELKEKLRSNDPANAYFQKVGSKPTSTGWEKVSHSTPMGSLGKVQEESEMRAWWKKGQSVVLSEKLDGISVTVEYKNGDLVLGATRGDGSTGDDITKNVAKMKGVKQKIGNFSGKLRGEIVLFKSTFEGYFEKNYKNERNAASGIAKRLDGEGCQHLCVLFYRVVLDDDEQQAKLKSKAREFELLRKLKMATPFNTILNSADDVQRLYERYIAHERSAIDYLIDGLVLDVNSNEYRDSVGEDGDGRPKGAIAYKFPHALGKTRLQDVICQTGKVGHVTPVAIFASVHINGVDISRASLATWGRVRKLQLTPGCLVLVARRNDVIPRIEANLEINSAVSNNVYKEPTSCSSCGYDLHHEGEYLVCGNKSSCPAQIRGGIQKWIEAIGLLDWGEAVLDALMDDHDVSEPADIYKIRGHILEDLMMTGRRLGTSAAKRMIQARDARKEHKLSTILGSMGIPMCAKNMCDLIVGDGFDTLEKLANVSQAELKRIDGLGPRKAKSFVDHFPAAKGKIEALLKAGIKLKIASSTGPLSNSTVCFTNVRDKDLEARIEDLGGQIKSSVTKNLTYLVADNVNGSSGKLTKARKQPTITTILDVKGINALLEQS